MQHAAYIDDIAAIIGNAVDVVAEFALPLIKPGVFAGVIGQLPDYSFNAGLFAALSAENLCNAWIKVQEHKSSAENVKLEEPQLGDDTDGVMHPNDMEE